jgi:hypothetical protein
VSEIEFCTLYVVAERCILGCMLRFMHAKNHFSDTLSVCPSLGLFGGDEVRDMSTQIQKTLYIAFDDRDVGIFIASLHSSVAVDQEGHR